MVNILKSGSSQALSSAKYVTKASDLSGSLRSDIVYIIDGQVDLGSTQIYVPEGGLNILGTGIGISGLLSSEDDYEMFVPDPSGSYSGNLFLSDVFFTVDGTNSKVFNLDNKGNSGAVEFNPVNFLNCTEIGEFSDYRQGFNSGTSFISCTDGITMSGTWSGWAAVDSNLVGAPFTGTLFKEGSNLVIQNSFRSNMNITGLADTGTFCDFVEANIATDGGFFLQGVRSNQNADPIPNLLPTSTRSRVSDCVAVKNTFVGGQVTFSNTSVINITASDTLFKANNTADFSEGYWCSLDNGNAIRYDSTLPTEVIIEGSFSLIGDDNDIAALQIRMWDDSESAYVNLGSEYQFLLAGSIFSSGASNVYVTSLATLDQNDRIEIWVKNITDTSNIQILSGSVLRVLRRA